MDTHSSHLPVADLHPRRVDMPLGLELVTHLFVRKTEARSRGHPVVPVEIKRSQDLRPLIVVARKGHREFLVVVLQHLVHHLGVHCFGPDAALGGQLTTSFDFNQLNGGRTLAVTSASLDLVAVCSRGRISSYDPVELQVSHRGNLVLVHIILDFLKFIKHLFTHEPRVR